MFFFEKRTLYDGGWAILTPLFYRSHRFKCGHDGPFEYGLEYDGIQKQFFAFRPEQKLCMRCSLREARAGFARCPGCHKPIMIGDMVSIEPTKLNDYKVRDIRLFGETNESVLVCQGCESGTATVVGFWTGADVDRIF